MLDGEPIARLWISDRLIRQDENPSWSDPRRSKSSPVRRSTRRSRSDDVDDDAALSPAVLHLEWGSVEVADLGNFKDVKLWPGGGRAWDWRETGTEHVPGIQPADVRELLEHGADVVVLTRGMEQMLQTCPETLEWLERHGVEVHVEETRAAVARYNELAADRRVGCLIHSTC